MSKRNWYAINKAAGGKAATVDIMDEIGFWGVTAADFARDLKSLGEGIELITLGVNSPGGYVSDAVAIHTMLKAHPARVVAHVVGFAMSAASYIITAADEVIVAKDAFIMIHLPASALEGGSEDFRRVADFLDKLTDQMVDTYATFMERDPGEVRAMLSAETWFTAEEAVAAGLADSVMPALKATAKFDVRRYAGTIPRAAMRAINRKEKEPVMDLTDENIDQIANAVAVKMNAAAAEAAAAAAAAATAAAEAEGNGGAATAEQAAANARNEASQIVAACTIARVPEMANKFLAEGKNLSEVLSDLAAVQNKGQPLNSRGGVGEPAPALDAAGVYAKWNKKK